MDKGRIFRIVIGAGIILAGLITNGSWWVIGLFPLMTGVINRCPSFLGQSACAIEEPQKKSDTSKEQ